MPAEHNPAKPETIKCPPPRTLSTSVPSPVYYYPYNNFSKAYQYTNQQVPVLFRGYFAFQRKKEDKEHQQTNHKADHKNRQKEIVASLVFASKYDNIAIKINQTGKGNAGSNLLIRVKK